ncbi:unnamed protein product [Orchesella dallaii]|uniref:FAD/NAD(P)-binding domain-containing protein n=1 Tax=Orchesella dallaii TaxID=48710 RepID=A0ABP1R336_9HEXA
MKETGVYSISRPLGKIFSHQRVAVAIGSGASAVAFAQSLREGRWEGRIVLISKDNFLPYDKTRLSETVNLSAENLKLKDADWFQHLGIELRLNTAVHRVDMTKRKLYVETTRVPVPYTKLFIGTGSRGRLPTTRLVPGINLKNIYTISDIHEAQRVYDVSKGKTVVIEGSGFIAMELVSTMKNYAKMSYIVTRQKRPFQTVLGETIGKALQRHIMKNVSNVEFFTFDEIRSITGNEKGEVKMVKTLKKREINCDVVVYAIGSVPNSELFSADKRALVSKSGHIVVTEFCETNVTDVYAGGDVALVPLDCAVTGTATIAHWNFASYTGKIAAARILHINESIKPYIPFYYTSFCGITLRYTGFGDHYDESIIFGDIFDNLKFCVLYRRERKILACATVNADPIAARVCFNIGDHFQWEPGVYPKIITDTFPELPILGEEFFGFKLDRETCITLYDSQSTTEEAVRRGNRQFDASQYKDTEFPLGLAEDKQMNFVFMM